MPAINPAGDAMNIVMVQFSPEPATTKEEVTRPGPETELFGRKAKEMGVRLRVSVLTALATAAWQTGVAGATDKTDVMAVVQQYTDDFNKRGTQSSLALCADQAIIIDDFPPYEWSGSGACAKWLSDFHAFTPQIQLTDLVATLGKARHVYVTADRAYVVVPATVTAKEQGKPVHETGATWTFALQKGPSGWRIAGWGVRLRNRRRQDRRRTLTPLDG